MPLISTRGAASAQGFGEFAQSAAPVYIEDVFSTYLYTGNGSFQTIKNEVNLSDKGGLVWLKSRSASENHLLYDTARGTQNVLSTNLSSAQTTGSLGVELFKTDGFLIGGTVGNTNAATYASWTFREQPKFFDVVTYTGNGANRTIAHNLGSVPGCIIVKRTDTTGNWAVYHRSLANTEWLVLNDTTGKLTDTTLWNSTTATSANFSLGTSSEVNANGGTYVAYIFAHNAGGFGLSGTDNVVSCGSYTTSSTSDSPIISLGYEPQLVLVKLTNVSGDWRLFDNMRGAATGGIDALLRPNFSSAESSISDYITFNSTGFQQSPDIDQGANSYIYIAIRRGPMKVPTSGTSVFNQSSQPVNTVMGGVLSFPDLVIGKSKSISSSWQFIDRLRGIRPFPSFTAGATSSSPRLSSDSTAAETNTNSSFLGQAIPAMGGVQQSVYGMPPTSLDALVGYFFRRAPGFMDVVCYTGTGVARTVNHNLAAVPQMIIVKNRENGISAWRVYHVNLGNTYYLTLNENVAIQGPSGSFWNSTTPTSSVFSVGTISDVNQSTLKIVAYLFATLAGVSKVGSYTGSGTTKQIDCGFTGGARFVLIKRTDSTGDWYVYDSARGIVAGNDPYLFLNSTAAEVTSTDYVDTYSAGFELSSTAPAGLNANGGTYIFLAIA